MSDPIRVSREQWDAAYDRWGKYCGDPDDAWHGVEMILGPRPGPDTPPDLRIDGICAMRVIRGLFDHGPDWAIEPFGMTEWDYITPEDGERIRAWLAEVHEWASEQVEEARDDARDEARAVIAVEAADFLAHGDPLDRESVALADRVLAALGPVVPVRVLRQWIEQERSATNGYMDCGARVASFALLRHLSRVLDDYERTDP